MSTKQILKLVATFLGKEELLECSYFTESEDTLTDEQTKELDILLRCLNLVVSEISTEYLPIYHEKEVTFSDGKLLLSEIDKDLFQICSLKDQFGNNVKFRIFDSHIKANVTNATVVYTVFASACTLEGNVDEFCVKIPDRVFAYGTAMEYSFISSLFDDAQIWGSRYKNSLLSISSKKHNVVMPKRRWL